MKPPNLLDARLQAGEETATLRRIYGDVALKPVAFLERLDRIEAYCINTLTRVGCWHDGRLRSFAYWQFGKDATREKHKAKAAQKMRVVHAWECLCLVRDLKGLIRKGGEDAMKVAVAAMMVESKASVAITEEKLANAAGSRRLQSPEEAKKESASVALYLRTRPKRKGGAFEAYVDGAKSELPLSVYMPKSKDGFRKKREAWQKKGLI